MEGAAPGDLPGRDVNQDEMELQEQLTHLKQHTTFETLGALHSCASPQSTIMSYFMFPFNITRPPPRWINWPLRVKLEVFPLEAIRCKGQSRNICLPVSWSVCCCSSSNFILSLCLFLLYLWASCVCELTACLVFEVIFSIRTPGECVYHKRHVNLRCTSVSSKPRALTLWKTMDMMKKSSRKLSEACGQSKWKKTSVKSRVRNWKLGSQKDERRSFSPATVVRRTSQLEGQREESSDNTLTQQRNRCDADAHSLDPQLLAVAEGEAVIGERAQHDGGVHHVLLEAQETHVQSLEPHENGVLCNTRRSKETTQTDARYFVAIHCGKSHWHRLPVYFCRGQGVFLASYVCSPSRKLQRRLKGNGEYGQNRAHAPKNLCVLQGAPEWCAGAAKRQVPTA